MALKTLDPTPHREPHHQISNHCEASTEEQGELWKLLINYVCSAVSSVDLGFALEEKPAQNCFYGDRNPLGCSRQVTEC